MSETKEKTIYVVTCKGSGDNLVKATSKANALAYFASARKATADDVAELKTDKPIPEAE